ncbi:DUF6318 family protein [Kocuria sp. NPDC057446]|uniref:DUF6318 family protein n=1 Tax=Kocuria sp. NPDC057446 TaxID=3346137 RepID=UPI0036BDFB27
MVRSNPDGTALGVAVLAALLLTGCGPDDDDGGAAASPSSPAPSAAPTTAEPGPGATPADYVPASLDGPAQNVPVPVMPDLAREESREGAQAFLDYWSDAMWYAHQTGDAEYAQTIISDSCDICTEQLMFIEDVYGDGAWFVGGRESPKIQDASIQRSSDGVYKPIVITSAEGLKLVEHGEVTYEASPRSGEGDPFPVYLDYAEKSWIYITAANLPGAGKSNG